MPVKLTILRSVFLRMHKRCLGMLTYTFLCTRFSEIFDIETVVVSREFVIFTDLFFRNYFDTNFTFKADLGMIIYSILVQR